MRFVGQTTITNAVCQLAWPPLSPNDMCTSVEGERAGCVGDDGGPLTIIRNGQHLQIGVLKISFCGVSYISYHRFNLVE